MENDCFWNLFCAIKRDSFILLFFYYFVVILKNEKWELCLELLLIFYYFRISCGLSVRFSAFFECNGKFLIGNLEACKSYYDFVLENNLKCLRLKGNLTFSQRFLSVRLKSLEKVVKLSKFQCKIRH